MEHELPPVRIDYVNDYRSPAHGRAHARAFGSQQPNARIPNKSVTSGAVWHFERRGRKAKLRVDGPLIFNTTPPQVDAALAGLGIALLPETEINEKFGLRRDDLLRTLAFHGLEWHHLDGRLRDA
jgi:DNA-binding transcriptional LysR family regulator